MRSEQPGHRHFEYTTAWNCDRHGEDNVVVLVEGDYALLVTYASDKSGIDEFHVYKWELPGQLGEYVRTMPTLASAAQYVETGKIPEWCR